MQLPVPDHVDDCAATCSGRRAFFRDALRAAVAISGLSALAPVGELDALDALEANGRGVARYPVPDRDGVSIDKKNEVILCRAAGEIYAFALACPHQRTALRAMPGTAGFQCPRHKSRYEQDGTFISGRATRSMDRLPITREGGAVVVELDVAIRSDKDPARWAAAHVKV